MLKRFLDLAVTAPNAVALIDGETNGITTRTALVARIDELAERFNQAGLSENDVVAVQLPNSVDFVAAFGAILKLKLVAILIDRDATETEVGNVLGHFASRGLIYRSGAEVMISTRQAGGVRVPKGARLIKLTSGSTGMPKGIV